VHDRNVRAHDARLGAPAEERAHRVAQHLLADAPRSLRVFVGWRGAAFPAQLFVAEVGELLKRPSYAHRFEVAHADSGGRVEPIGLQIDALMVSELSHRVAIQQRGVRNVLERVIDELRGDRLEGHRILLEPIAERCAGPFQRVGVVGQRERERAQIDKPCLFTATVLVAALDATPREQGAAWVDRLEQQPRVKTQVLPAALFVEAAPQAKRPAAPVVAARCGPVARQTSEVEREVEPHDGAAIAVLIAVQIQPLLHPPRHRLADDAPPGARPAEARRDVRLAVPDVLCQDPEAVRVAFGKVVGEGDAFFNAHMPGGASTRSR
jgi:hypothetical protein